jgi:hypothetical protein
VLAICSEFVAVFLGVSEVGDDGTRLKSRSEVMSF